MDATENVLSEMFIMELEMDIEDFQKVNLKLVSENLKYSFIYSFQITVFMYCNFLILIFNNNNKFIVRINRILN